MDTKNEISLPEWELERLSELVARRVQDKMLARFGKWAILNLLTIGAVAGGATIAFFNLRADVQTNNLINATQDAAIKESKSVSLDWRNEVTLRLDRQNDKLDMIREQIIVHRVNQAPQINGNSKR